jgi:hypothetical protein
VINIIVHLIIKFIINTTMGPEVRTTDKVMSQGTLGFQMNSAEVYNCTHTEEWDEPPYPCTGVRVALRLPTFPQCGSHAGERFDKAPV